MKRLIPLLGVFALTSGGLVAFAEPAKISPEDSRQALQMAESPEEVSFEGSSLVSSEADRLSLDASYESVLSLLQQVIMLKRELGLDIVNGVTVSSGHDDLGDTIASLNDAVEDLNQELYLNNAKQITLLSDNPSKQEIDAFKDQLDFALLTIHSPVEGVVRELANQLQSDEETSIQAMLSSLESLYSDELEALEVAYSSLQGVGDVGMQNDRLQFEGLHRELKALSVNLDRMIEALVDQTATDIEDIRYYLEHLEVPGLTVQLEPTQELALGDAMSGQNPQGVNVSENPLTRFNGVPVGVGVSALQAQAPQIAYVGGQQVADYDPSVSGQVVQTPSQGDTFNQAWVGFSDVSELLMNADKYVGTPYVWGGKSPAGFDCSGFTQYVFAETYGIDIGPSTYQQQYAGDVIDLSDAQAGDLYLFGGYGSPYHVALATDNQGGYIHAVQPGTPLQYGHIGSFAPDFAVRVL